MQIIELYFMHFQTFILHQWFSTFFMWLPANCIFKFFATLNYIFFKYTHVLDLFWWPYIISRRPLVWVSLFLYDSRELFYVYFNIFPCNVLCMTCTDWIHSFKNTLHVIHFFGGCRINNRIWKEPYITKGIWALKINHS